MAVPKKRRICSKILNRGFRNHVLYSNMVGSTISRLSMSYLKKLADSHNVDFLKVKQLPLSFGLVVKKTSKGKKIRSTKVNRFFQARPAAFSPRSLRLGFGTGSALMSQWGYVAFDRSLDEFEFYFTVLVGKVLYNPHPYVNSNFLYHYPNLKFLIKRGFLLFKAPHRWGGQKNFLLKKWELSPRYLFLTPIREIHETTLHLPLGVIRITYPRNLSTPKGPSLKDLWAYTKANPNEGYWIYCMWLQVKKKWKRWIRFPVQYIVRRNVLRRAALTHYYGRSVPMYGHRLNDPYKPNFPENLGTRLPIKRAPKGPFSIATRLALLLRDSSFFQKNEFNDRATRSRYLKGRLSIESKFNRLRWSNIANVASAIFLKLAIMVKRPWL